MVKKMTEKEIRPNNELEDLRASLDNIDNALVFLLAERFRVTHKVGVHKAERGLPPVDKSREERQFERIEHLAENAGLSPEFAHKILRLIIDEVVENHIAIQERRGNEQNT